MAQDIVNKQPIGWVNTTIGDISDYVQRGKGPRYTGKNEFPVVNQKAVRWFGIQEEHLKYVSEEQWDKWTEERYIREGDILWNSTGAGTIGRACFLDANEASKAKVVDSHVTIIRSNINIDSKYVFYWVMHPAIQGDIAGLYNGSTNQVELSKGKVLSTELPLAPLPEQKRIVEKLDSLLAQVDTIQQRLNNLPSIIKRFRQSVLVAAVSGKLTEQWRGDNDCEEWANIRLGDVVTPISQGWSPKCNNIPASEGDWGVIKTSAVQSIHFVEQENKELPEHLEPRDKLQVKKGDILVTRAGPRVRCGITCLVTEIKSKLMICDKVYRFQVKEDKGKNKFLVLQLNSLKYLEDIEKLKTGISDSGMNLTQKKFRDLLLEWPSISEQTEIVRLVEQYFALADTLEKNLANAKQRVDNLTQSILAKAFKGQLLPQDENDEPADKLLERIKAARIDSEKLEKAAKNAAKASKSNKAKKI
jgi:type I restriction enzyme S subunit